MEIKIDVKSSRFQKETGREENNFSCIGQKDVHGGKTYLRYTEPQGGASVIIRVENDAVYVTRSGEAHSRFAFRKGVTDYSKYLTPYGDFLMAVKPCRVVITEGKIDLGYSLTVNETEKSENNFCLIYKEI